MRANSGSVGEKTSYWVWLICCNLLSSICFSHAAESAEPQASPPAEPNAAAAAGSETDLLLEAPRPARNQVSFSADYLIGNGELSIPTGFGVGRVPDYPGIPSVQTPSRDSDYFGATASYSLGQTWFLDFSYAHGDSSGTVNVGEILGIPANVLVLNGPFKISDDWYEAYFRYAFPRGRKFSSYLRAGFTFVQSHLTLKSDAALGEVSGGIYNQTTDTDDYLGSVGFGIGYQLFTGKRARWSLQLEGEGFGGNRSQDSTERALNRNDASNPYFGTANINNLEYGGLGRLIARFEYELGRKGLFKLFADGGIQTRYTLVEYSEFTTHNVKVESSTPGELLWGPYVRVGFRYSF